MTEQTPKYEVTPTSIAIQLTRIENMVGEALEGKHDLIAGLAVSEKQLAEARQALSEIRQMVAGATSLPTYPKNIPDLHEMILRTIGEIFHDEDQN